MQNTRHTQFFLLDFKILTGIAQIMKLLLTHFSLPFSLTVLGPNVLNNALFPSNSRVNTSLIMKHVTNTLKRIRPWARRPAVLNEVFHFISPLSKTPICYLRPTGRMGPAKLMSAASGNSRILLTHVHPSEGRIIF
jgi:hypothetical protein